MAITTTYSVQSLGVVTPSFITQDADVTSLAGGGFAIAGAHAGHVDFSNYDANAALIGSATSVTGTNVSVTGLNNGNLVIATQDGDSIQYSIRSPSGGVVLAAVDMPDIDSTNAEVAALKNGGFVIVNQDSTGNNHLDIYIFNAAGVQTGAAGVFAGNNINPSVAVLDDGNIALGWTVVNGANTEFWTAVYAPTGAVVKAPALVDNFGTINNNVSLAAINNGYVAVYEDNGWDGNTDITMAQFTSAGVFVDYTKISNGGTDAGPQVTRVSGDIVAITYENNSFPDTDIITTLFDGATGAALTGGYNTLIGDSVVDDVQNTSTAAYSGGRIAVVGDDVTDGVLNVETLAAIRIITGDALANTLTAQNDMRHQLVGADGADTLNGGALDDRLFGGAANDKLNGGAGADYMDGGAGNDTYTVDNAGDVVVEGAGGGTDTVKSSINYTLTAEVEKLTLAGTAVTGTGNGLNNTITGNAQANTLSGEAGNDKLDGKGGPDTLIGGTGNDTYTVAAGDIVIEAAGEGNDTVNTDLNNYTLTANVEKLNLTGAANIDGSGNNLNNTITGNNGNNVLRGEQGQDTLIGGAGNDTLIGGVHKDTLTGGAGADKFFFDNIGVSAQRDTVNDFVSGTDQFVFDKSVFTAFAAYAPGSTINAGDFKVGAAATTANQNIIYDNTTGALYYDQDGVGGVAQVQIAQLIGIPTVLFTDIFVA